MDTYITKTLIIVEVNSTKTGINKNVNLFSRLIV